MQDPTYAIAQASRREPWNKGKLIGAKPPLRPKHFWSIRTKLQIAGRTRDLAIFNLAIDSKLRGCDVVSLRVEDVAPHGHALDRATLLGHKKIESTVRCLGIEVDDALATAAEEELARFLTPGPHRFIRGSADAGSGGSLRRPAPGVKEKL